MSKDFIISFYIEGNEDVGFYAWLSQSSPKAEFGRGATIYEAISNLCRLLSGEFTDPDPDLSSLKTASAKLSALSGRNG